ncbi:NAD(P)H-dependent flavin oxidoreductase [Taibaiella soli]|uniref:Propionate 3-nitronate monooxygenase n=1 Tax=Taibaiella soli TaxID=1649169 RepID=A0A2W2A7D8_9BACT|nr:nitronate monooxygenase [Taibaiella soli]PZF71245.1 nitronate monooxygenase [Taibaiella soli]
MNWTNDITRLLNVTYPIIQAPMFGVSTPEMAVAASNAGCLGSLALADLPADKCAQLIRATRQLTTKPFAANIFLNEIPEITDELKRRYNAARLFIEQLAHEHRLEVVLPEIDSFKITDYHDQVDALIEARCPIVSFTFGNLDTKSIEKLKAAGTLLMGTCTSVAEAMELEQTGSDIICVQGWEAGGHRGSFIPENIPQIGGFSLLAQVYDSVKTPVVYAGGIYNATTLSAARKLGAQGFQIGSIFIASKESQLQEFEIKRLMSAREEDIILTKSFSGRYARGIKNIFTEAVENASQIVPYPYQNKLTGELRKAAKANKNADFVNIWAGQSLHPFSEASTGVILKELIAAVNQLAVDS